MSAATFLDALPVLLVMATGAWLLSVWRRDVSIVDSFWSLMIFAAGLVFYLANPAPDRHDVLLLLLTGAWAVRLSLHVTVRNWGQPEDRRYRAIRERHSPGFALKSLPLVFGFQALVAWIVALPLVAMAAPGPAQPAVLVLGVTLFLAGLLLETLADWQLYRFSADPANRGRVLDTGLWRYSRHPNYFGEFCVWWGLYGAALAEGLWWTLPAPVMVTVLLLRFSGVALMEKDIGAHRPAYRDYMRRTSPFWPTRPRAASGGDPA